MRAPNPLCLCLCLLHRARPSLSFSFCRVFATPKRGTCARIGNLNSAAAAAALAKAAIYRRGEKTSSQTVEADSCTAEGGERDDGCEEKSTRRAKEGMGQRVG